MESGNLPIIHNAVPEKIYGGYKPGSVYKPSEGDSGFYDLFVRQMSGPAAAEDSRAAGDDGARRAEADLQEEMRTRQAARDRSDAESRASEDADRRAQSVKAQAERDRGRDVESEKAASSGKQSDPAAEDAESEKSTGIGSQKEKSEKASSSDRGASQARNAHGDEKEQLEALKVFGDKKLRGKEGKESSRTAEEGKKKPGTDGGEGARGKEEDGVLRPESAKGAADKAQTGAEAAHTAEAARETRGKEEKQRVEAEKVKTGLQDKEHAHPGVIELQTAGKEKDLTGERKIKESNRTVRRDSERFKADESGKGRVVIDDRRTVKASEKDGTSAQGKKDGGGTDKQNLEFRQAVKDELLDKSEKIVRIGNEQLERLQDGKPVPTGRNNGLSHNSELLRQLRESGNRQIVKHTGIILKDNSSGEIKLVLKPENLGDVRIRLQLTENSITGKILVDNQMVRAAFEQNLEALYKAFKESGFDSASLDVQVGGEAGHGKGKKEGGEPEYAARHIKFLEEQIPLTHDGNFADTVIDLVV